MTSQQPRLVFGLFRGKKKRTDEEDAQNLRPSVRTGCRQDAAQGRLSARMNTRARTSTSACTRTYNQTNIDEHVVNVQTVS